MTKKNNNTRFPADFLKTIDEKNVIFRYSEGVRMSEIISGIASDAHDYFRLPLIYLHREENNRCLQIDENVSTIVMQKNLTSTMIELERMIFGRRLVSIIDEMALSDDRPTLIFLATLLRKNRENRGVLLSSYKKGSFDPAIEEQVLGNYDIVFDVDENTIIRKGATEKERIRYIFSSSGFTTELPPLNDVDRIKEIFRLTPEEKKELDRIIGEQIEEFSEPRSTSH